MCVGVCPKKLIRISESLNKKGYYPAEIGGNADGSEDSGRTGCALCAIACPDVAIEVYRMEKKKAGK